jgi:hypothetical protein
MKFHKLTISVTLAIAATAAIPSATRASSKYNLIAKHIGLQTAKFHSSQPKLLAESTSVNQTGKTFFDNPPQLIRAAAIPIDRIAPATYEFTLMVPENAGQPLKAVTIAQTKNLETVRFNASNSKAFLGKRFTGGTNIRLASVGGGQPPNPNEVTIVFDQPVKPGSTVTVALAAERNPSRGGVYEFGVTAYPAGENGMSQFLGYGRINFDDSSR